MSRRENRVRLLERRFRVNVPLGKAWAHLEKVEQWPTWATHIRRVELKPPGPLRPESEGILQLTNGIRSTFRMEEINPELNWRWAGPFLWLTVHYDHQFSRIGPEESEIGFVLEVEGFGAGLFGRLLATIYSLNLNRATPNLVKELERE